MRSRRHIVGLELGDVLCVLEDHTELLGEPFDLVVGELESREPGDMHDLIARNP
jgi:hypothetical protein